ncbi:hypothetical protein [Roseomonas sp. HF4]|uniref:hypothetical protein n=1 Tax=Roseomonas sp. HF4 TaxID=2562313 RepID=UPI0010C041C0|nr:hypothetical protein [Roseomonas sp. HF4]
MRRLHRWSQIGVLASLLLAACIALGAFGATSADEAAPHGHDHDHDAAAEPDPSRRAGHGHHHGPADHLHEATMPAGGGGPLRGAARAPPSMAPADELTPRLTARLERPPRPAA